MFLQLKSCFCSVLNALRYFLYSGLDRLLSPVVNRLPPNRITPENISRGTAKLGSGSEHEQSSRTKSPGVTTLYQQFPHDPYVGFGVVDIGLTGIVLKIDEDRVVKKAKDHSLESLSDLDRVNTQYINDINRSTLVHEIEVYKRLGRHEGIIPASVLPNLELS